MKQPEHPAQRTVAMVCSKFHPEFGGPSIAIRRLAPRLEKSGVRILVLSRKPPGAAAREQDSCLTIIRSGGARGERLSDLRFSLSVLRHLFLLRRRYECIHVFFSGWMTFLTPLLGRLLGKRTSFTMTLLDSDDPENIARTRLAGLKLRLYRMYDRVIHINPEQGRRYEKIYGTSEPLLAGSMGIDVDRFRPPTPEQRVAARDALGLDESAPVAAFSGALIFRKGIDRAVEIWLRVVEEKPDAQLVLLGPLDTNAQLADSLHSRLMERIEASGRMGNFRFLGSSPDLKTVVRHLHAADIFLFPSRSEGTPSAVMEAMACGVVPVLTPLPGFTGVVVRDAVEGLVLQLGEGTEAWAERILRLLDDRERLKELAARGCERVHLTHSQEKAVEALMQAWALPPIAVDQG